MFLATAITAETCKVVTAEGKQQNSGGPSMICKLPTEEMRFSQKLITWEKEGKP